MGTMNRIAIDRRFKVTKRLQIDLGKKYLLPEFAVCVCVLDHCHDRCVDMDTAVILVRFGVGRTLSITAHFEFHKKISVSKNP